MTSLQYYLLDVFTDQPFAGNPLAVFPDAPPLEPTAMQQIAAELNLSETAFVMPARVMGALRRVRFFTPRMELAFAGHPTVGTALLLSELGMAPRPAREAVAFTLEEAVGLVAIAVSRRGERLHAELTMPGVPVGAPGASPADLAALIGLESEDLAPPPDEPGAYSAGVPYLFIAVRDVAALHRARIDGDRWRRVLSGWWAPHVYVIWRESERRIRARMFAPAMGIAEDPATGAAAAALPGWLARGNRLPIGDYHWTIEQGVEMGRPSRMDLRFEVTRAGVHNVRLGGGAVRIGEGVLHSYGD